MAKTGSLFFAWPQDVPELNKLVVPVAEEAAVAAAWRIIPPSRFATTYTRYCIEYIIQYIVIKHIHTDIYILHIITCTSHFFAFMVFLHAASIFDLCVGRIEAQQM